MLLRQDLTLTYNLNLSGILENKGATDSCKKWDFLIQHGAAYTLMNTAQFMLKLLSCLQLYNITRFLI